MLAYLYWDPPRSFLPFDLPFLGRPILWYGVLFALGFLLGFWVLLYLMKKMPQKEIKSHAKVLSEQLVFYIVIGTIIGARLGDVFFYQAPENYLSDPISIFKVWEGGLASHGGAIGILVALWLFRRCHPQLSWAQWLDLVVIPAGLVGFFIRFGNFVNQEILGKQATVPWAVVFGHAADGSVPQPRHPVQLYEAGFYLAIFVLLFWGFHKWKLKAGQMSGIFLTLVFAFRFFIEFFKEEQSMLVGLHPALDMGQILSLPLLVLGLYMILRK